MVKRKLLPKKKMVVSNVNLIVLGIVFAVVMTLVYVWMTNSKENLDDIEVIPAIPVSTGEKKPDVSVEKPDAGSDIQSRGFFKKLWKDVKTWTKDNLTKFSDWAEKERKENEKNKLEWKYSKEKPKPLRPDYFKDRERECKVGGGHWYPNDYNTYKGMMNRKLVGLGGNCYTITDEYGTAKYFCCDRQLVKW